MLGEFTYCNPTRLYFGKEALDGLRQELKKYGPQVRFAMAAAPSRKTEFMKR